MSLGRGEHINVLERIEDWEWSDGGEMYYAGCFWSRAGYKTFV